MREKPCCRCRKPFIRRSNRQKYCKECSKKEKAEKSSKWQRESRYKREGSVRRTAENYQWYRTLKKAELTKNEIEALITKKRQDISHEKDPGRIKALRTMIKQLTIMHSNNVE